MSEDYNDDWGTESGLPEKFNFTVKSASFGYDAKYNNGETLLLTWEGVSDKPFGQDESLEFTQSYPVGKGWVTLDGGATAVNENGRAKFNKNSAYGKIIDSALAKDGLNIAHLLRERGLPTQANVWEGLTFFMDIVETNYGGEIGVKSRLTPVKFVGADAGAAAGAAAGGTSTTPAAVKATTTSGASQGLTESPNKVLEAALVTLAKGATSHEQFVTQALEVEGVVDDADLLEAVVDETAGLYFKVKASV